MRKFTEFQLRVLETQDVNCSDVVKLLDDYTDKSLPPTLQRRVRSHIKSCDYCQEMEQSYRLTVELAHELRDQPIPKGVQTRLRKALNKRLGINLPA